MVPRHHRSQGITRFAPEVIACTSILMVLAAAFLGGHPGLQATLLTLAVIVIAVGWIWSMQAQGKLLSQARQEAERARDDRDDISRLLDASINAEPETVGQAGLRDLLADLATSVEAEAVACFLLDPTGATLEPQPGPFGMRSQSLHMFPLEGPDAESLVVVLHDQVPMLQSKEDSPLVPGLLPTRFDRGSVALVPLLTDEDAIGLIAIACEAPDKFNQQSLALAAATALDCAALVQRERYVVVGRELARLTGVMRDAALAINSTLPLRDMLYVILGKARAVAEFDRACIALFDGSTYEVVAFVEAGDELRRRAPETTRRKIAGSPFAEIAKASVLLRENVTAGFATEAGETGASYTEALVPMRVQGELVGCAAFRAPGESGFPPRVQGALMELANLAAVAVGAYLGAAAAGAQAEPAATGGEGKRDVPAEGKPEAGAETRGEDAKAEVTATTAPEARREAEKAPAAAPEPALPPVLSPPPPPKAADATSGLDFAAEIPLLLAATTRGPDALEQQITETVSRLFDSPVAVLTRMEGEVQRVATTIGATSELPQPPISPGDGLLGSRDLADGTLRMNDVKPGELLPPLSSDTEVTSGLGAPIRVDDVFIGAVAAFRSRPFRLGEASLMKSVAEHLGVALRNADVYYRSQRTLWELANLNQGLQAIGAKEDITEILRAVLARAISVAQADTGSVMLVEEGELRIVIGQGAGKKASEEMVLSVGQGLAGKAAETRQTVVANEVASEREWVPSKVPGSVAPRSLLCVPLVAGDETLAVLNIADYDQTGAFDDEAVSVVNALARQAAMAVGNARLRQQLGAEKERLKQLQAVIRETLGQTS